jgi:hypothetical protein
MVNLDRLKAFLDDEAGGERDTLTTLLILALIIIPLILVIIVFGEDIMAYAQDKWDEVMGSGVGG